MSLVHSEAVEEDLDNVDCVSEDGPEKLIFTGIIFDNYCKCLAALDKSPRTKILTIFQFILELSDSRPPCRLVFSPAAAVVDRQCDSIIVVPTFRVSPPSSASPSRAPPSCCSCPGPASPGTPSLGSWLPTHCTTT